MSFFFLLDVHIIQNTLHSIAISRPEARIETAALVGAQLGLVGIATLC